MPSDKSTVATKADFVPKVVGETDRDRSFSSVLAHDERSQQPRPEVHPEALNVLGGSHVRMVTGNPSWCVSRRAKPSWTRQYKL